MSEVFIAALDVGTTTIRCHVINNLGKFVGTAYSDVKLYYPDEKCVEINPDELWDTAIDVVKNAVIDAKTNFKQIKCLGISTQRATFLTWRRDNWKPLHKLITWKDLRASELTAEVNQSWKMVGLRAAAYLLYFFTRIKKMGLVSKLKFSSIHVTIRLLWILQNHAEVKEALRENNLMFGTLETWLVYKLTGGKTYVSDISNASATGLYDPFALKWSIIPKILNIPETIFPPVVDNDYDFGETLSNFFGIPIRIASVMADQSSSMYGSCNFHAHDLKMTLGTGAFIDVNTVDQIHPNLNGMYPCVGWKIRNKLVYFSEVPCSDTGSLVQWMLNAGLISSPADSDIIASKVQDSGGVYFIPAFSGLGPPINDETAASGFIGVTASTKREHLVRAVLESIVFRIILAYNMMREERGFNFKCVKVDGGVSKNNFICQMLADITNLKVHRLSSEMSVLGVALVAGLSCGMWRSPADFVNMNQIQATFEPITDTNYRKTLAAHLNQWQKASQRFMTWYES